MSTGYKHGAYGTIGGSVVSSANKATAAPVIVGTAPVNLIRGYATAGIINKPVRLANISAKNTIGYSSDWSSFTLNEVVSAFFDNAKGNIGPIYVINVLDPDTHREEEKTTVSLSFTNGRAYIESDTIILDTFALEDKVEGTDYNLSYNFITGKLAITSVDSSNKLTGSIDASYYEVDPEAVKVEDIIGTVTDDGEYTGLQAAALLYPQLNVITNLLAAPGWSEKPAVYEALVEFSQQINGHWYAFTFADLPLVASGVAVDTREKAITWAAANGYDSMFAKIFWPQAKTKNGELYHLSTLALVEAIRTDMSHDGVPMETCSNKSIPVAAQYFGSTSTNQGYDQNQANELNAKGITTLAAWAGEYVIWGPHTAAFEAGEDGNAENDVDAMAIFDTNVRMQEYILNSFQERWGSTVDEPMNKNLKDTILEQEQQKLDALTSQGALLGNPTVEFLETENSTSDLMNGNFKWNFVDTPTPPAKSLTAEVAYSDAGFSTYFGEEE